MTGRLTDPSAGHREHEYRCVPADQDEQQEHREPQPPRRVRRRADDEAEKLIRTRANTPVIAVSPALMRVLPVNPCVRHAMCRHELRKLFPPFEFSSAVRLDDVRAELGAAQHDAATGDVVAVVLIIRRIPTAAISATIAHITSCRAVSRVSTSPSPSSISGSSDTTKISSGRR